MKLHYFLFGFLYLLLFLIIGLNILPGGKGVLSPTFDLVLIGMVIVALVVITYHDIKCFSLDNRMKQIENEHVEYKNRFAKSLKDLQSIKDRYDV